MRGSIVIALVGLSTAAAALELPPTGIAYTIEVRIDPGTRGLAGRESIRWTNPTDAPVASLRMHLYLNAFSHTRTTWLSEHGVDPEELDELYRVSDDPWGYMEPQSITQVDGSGRHVAQWAPIQPDDGNPLDRSLIEVALAEPVAPGAATRIDVEFEGRLPLPVARTGARNGFYFLAQWYPKIGVLEPAGVRGATTARWAARQFHAPTEFYADFAEYDVTIVAPGDWIVGATGRRIGEAEPDGSGFSRHRFVQRAVHDFAAVAGRDLAEWSGQVTPTGPGPTVDVRHIVPRGTEHQIPRWHAAVEGAMDELARRVGPYPYDALTVVTPPFAAIGVSGMEYPTLITGGLGDPMWDWLGELRLPETTVIHELAHQYFYGLVATNEQEEAFLDEGLAQYLEITIGDELYGSGRGTGWLFGRALDTTDGYAYAIEQARATIREPIRRTPTALYAPGTWGLQVYNRTALTLRTAERLFGREVLDRVLAEYFLRFAFGHPDLDDFLRVVQEIGGEGIGSMVREGFLREAIPDFSVTEATAEPWTPPVGRLTTDLGVTTLGREAGEHDEAGLDPRAREEDGNVLVEITDPGWVRGGESTSGTVRRRPFAPVRGEADAGRDDSAGWYESTALLAGPAWDHLPVHVELRFADGTIVRDRWDGKAAWRRYRIVRQAPLTDVRIDPERTISIDVVPQNNARAVEPDARFVQGWSAWFAALAQWAAGSIAAWY